MHLSKRSRIETLLAEADDLEERFRQWQGQSDSTTSQEIRDGARAYLGWFARAIKLVPDESVASFRDAYEGGLVITRIRGFLQEPLALNDFYSDELEGNPFAPGRFRHSFDDDFKKNLDRQRGILVMALESEADAAQSLELAAQIMKRLPSYLAVLKNADNANVPSPAINTEADLQVVVEAALRLCFDDVRREDYVPQYGGGASRVDFLIKESGVIIECKMTRPTLKDKKVGEELIIDFARYRAHPDCAAILAVVYDPERFLSMPASLVNDLSQSDTEVPTAVIVVH